MTTEHAGPAVPGGECEREPDPSDSLRTFGAVVQALREHAELSRVQFGEIVRFSNHTAESVELGRRMPDLSFVERAEEALGNTGALRNSARFLTRGEAGLAAWLRQWARLERTAVSLCTYECRLVPGLLQSEGYVRALCENEIPPLPEITLSGSRVARPEPGATIVALWDADSRPTSLKAGYHGGASLAEFTIPVPAFLPFGAEPPKRWRELGDQRPQWGPPGRGTAIPSHPVRRLRPPSRRRERRSSRRRNRPNSRRRTRHSST
ncbi:Scr1 family TA system antitoxin-like transcriptional regulator [Streptomyces hirsutus]|uniref:helix-turn-helix domain-containing protein n=1 Tax=Streptomyces hirsutus TaxID=35620 RepID=UPI003318B5E2